MFTHLIFGAFTSLYSNRVGDVGYRIVSANGTVRIARTTAGITEQTDSDGNATTGTYLASVSLDPAWLPCREIWDIAGEAGVVALGVIGAEVAPLTIPTPPSAATIATAVVAKSEFTALPAAVAAAVVGTDEIRTLALDALEAEVSPTGATYKDADGEVVATRSKTVVGSTVTVGPVELV